MITKMHFPKSNVFASALCTLALINVIGPLQAQQPDGGAVPLDARNSSAASGSSQLGETVLLIGLPGMRQKEKGSLSISPSALTFAALDGHASVQRSEILNVSIGDVNVESGGTAGKITRAIIPFGGGSALATVTHKQLGLLTIESRDQSGALHGAVFLLPEDHALQAQRQLGAQTPQSPIESTYGSCAANGGISPDTIEVAAITTTGEPVPAEYRILIYEQLVRRLSDESKFSAVYRDGDHQPQAACPKYNLALTLDAFKKGNAAVRASTGPVGFFVGATKLKFHIQVKDVRGRTVFDKELQASKRGDTDSLDIADKIAKTLARELKKADMHTTKA